LSGYRNCGGSGVLLTGHTDRAGSPRYNLALADRRIKAVAAYLVAGGMPAQALSGEAHGESKPRVPTADGMREAQNRRVEITARAAAGI
jgi:outer membrane protein OmpA-like peptidoglycan-associated protein